MAAVPRRGERSVLAKATCDGAMPQAGSRAAACCGLADPRRPRAGKRPRDSSPRPNPPEDVARQPSAQNATCSFCRTSDRIATLSHPARHASQLRLVGHRPVTVRTASRAARLRRNTFKSPACLSACAPPFGHALYRLRRPSPRAVSAHSGHDRWRLARSACPHRSALSAPRGQQQHTAVRDHRVNSMAWRAPPLL